MARCLLSCANLHALVGFPRVILTVGKLCVNNRINVNADLFLATEHEASIKPQRKFIEDAALRYIDLTSNYFLISSSLLLQRPN